MRSGILTLALVLAPVLAPVFAAHAGDGPAPQNGPPLCADPQKSADYIPGVDAYGRAVAPADLPGGPSIDVNSTVHVEVRTRNRAAPYAGVDVTLNNLGPPRPCPAATPTPRR